MLDISIDNLVKNIENELPHVSSIEVKNLTTIINAISNNHVDDEYMSNEWLPSKSSVQEVLSLGLKIHDLERTIQSFIRFANDRGYNQHLDSKFVTHVKMQLK
jgi:hypothetical protein